MTGRQTLGNVCLFIALTLLTLSIIGGLPLPLLRKLAWVNSKKYETGVWGYCPVLPNNVASPSRYCNAFQRPCLSEDMKNTDRTSIIWHLVLFIVAWLFTALALVQCFLHRPWRQPAIYSGVAGAITSIAIYLVYVFSDCTIGEIHKTGDHTARRGNNVYIAATSAALMFVAAAAYWFEFKFVEKLHVTLLAKKKATTTTVVV
ncbi:hypothetical protein DFJ77DRAFT_478330, partial [Powellomyces hirtus]